MIAAWLSFTALMCFCVAYYYYRRQNSKVALDDWERQRKNAEISMTNMTTSKMHEDSKWQVHEVESGSKAFDPHRHASLIGTYNVYDNNRRTSHFETKSDYTEHPPTHPHPHGHPHGHPQHGVGGQEPNRHASLIGTYNVYDNNRRSSHFEAQRNVVEHETTTHAHIHPHDSHAEHHHALHFQPPHPPNSQNPLAQHHSHHSGHFPAQHSHSSQPPPPHHPSLNKMQQAQWKILKDIHLYLVLTMFTSNRVAAHTLKHRMKAIRRSEMTKVIRMIYY